MGKVNIKVSQEQSDRLVAACDLMLELSNITFEKMRKRKVDNKHLVDQMSLIVEWQSLRKDVEEQIRAQR